MNFEIVLGHVLTLDLFQVMEAVDSQYPKEHRALVDNGSQETTTNTLFLLHNYTPINNPRDLRDAVGKVTQVKLEDQDSVVDEDDDFVEEDVSCLLLDDVYDLRSNFSCQWKPVCLMISLVLLEKKCI